MGEWDSIWSHLASTAKSCLNGWLFLASEGGIEKPLPIKTKLVAERGTQATTPIEFENPFKAIEHVIQQDGKLLLLEGEPGQGKTAALLWTAYLFCKQRVESWRPPHDDLKIPIFEYLGSVSIPHGASHNLETALLPMQPFRSKLPWLFLLDGLDLLPTAGFNLEPNGVVRQAYRMGKDFFVVSSRPASNLYQNIQEASGYSTWVIRLEGLSEEDREEWLRDKPSLAIALEKIYASTPGARALSNNPLLFYMLLGLARKIPDAHRALTIGYPGCAGIFSGFIEQLYQRAKGRALPPRGGAFSQGFNILAGVCWAAITDGELDHISREKLDRYFHKIGRKPEDIQHFNDSVNALRSTGVILGDEPLGTIHFIHQGFMEHLGGRYLSERLTTAINGGWLRAELWSHLSHERMDNMLSHALGLLEVGDRKIAILAVYDLLEGYNLSDRIRLLRAADPELTRALIEPLIDPGDDAQKNELERALTGIDVPAKAVKDSVPTTANELRNTAASSDVGEIVSAMRSKPILPPAFPGFPGAQDLLSEALMDDDEGVKLFAATALENPNTHHEDPLVTMLQCPSYEFRKTVIPLLGRLKSKKAVNSLIGILEEKNTEIRWEAMRALGEIGSVLAINPLLKLLSDTDTDKNLLTNTALVISQLLLDYPSDDPMKTIEAHASHISDTYLKGISGRLGRRWCGSYNMELIAFQRTLLFAGGPPMGSNNTINVTIHGSVNAPVSMASGGNANSSQTLNSPLDQAFAVLKEAFRQGQGLRQGISPVEAENVLDALHEAQKNAQSPAEIKEKWGLLQRVAKISELVGPILQAANTISTFIAGLG